MKLTKRKLNKILKAKLLKPNGGRNSHNIKDLEIRVVRARNVDLSWTHRRTGDRIKNGKTAVTIRIKGMVKATTGAFLPLSSFGPKHIRNFLRREDNQISSVVSQWVRLWGFDSNVHLETIELVYSKDDV